MSYETAKKRVETYTKNVEELPEMRRDTVELMKHAVGQKRKAYVLVEQPQRRERPLDDSGVTECFAARRYISLAFFQLCVS